MDVIAVWFAGLSTLSSVIDTTTDTALSKVLSVVVGVLFCWRVVKIVVLHGSPIPWGLKLSSGRENGGVSGRRVHIASIDHGNKLWFGVVLRAHPSSDKLARTRLECLVIALPFGRGLMVIESRIHWIGQAEEDKRYQYFIRTAGKYWKQSEFKSADQFRRDVVQHLDRISKPHGSGKRIDGLNWHFASSGGVYIVDDFGYELAADKSGEGSFEVKVTGLEDPEDRTIIVRSIDELREFARRELHPVQH